MKISLWSCRIHLLIETFHRFLGDCRSAARRPRTPQIANRILWHFWVEKGAIASNRSDERPHLVAWGYWRLVFSRFATLLAVIRTKIWISISLPMYMKQFLHQINFHFRCVGETCAISSSCEKAINDISVPCQTYVICCINTHNHDAWMCFFGWISTSKKTSNCAF